jgi:hypothetical protein
MTRIGPCTVQKERHICVVVDPKKYVRDQNGATFVAISGM